MEIKGKPICQCTMPKPCLTTGVILVTAFLSINAFVVISSQYLLKVYFFF